MRNIETIIYKGGNIYSKRNLIRDLIEKYIKRFYGVVEITGNLPEDSPVEMQPKDPLSFLECRGPTKVEARRSMLCGGAECQYF